MRFEDGVSHVIEGHVTVDAVVGQLTGRDSSPTVAEEAIKAVRLVFEFP